MKEQKTMEEKTPPFQDLQKIIELAGYKVIAIGAEHTGLRFTGVINLQIAPASILIQSDFVSFPQVSHEFLSDCCEYDAQRHQQEKGSGQE
jgi:hypothetical protein